MALTANRPLDSGLVLCLRMSEGVGTKTFDVSKYQNHGAIVGASWVDGKYGKALSFNGQSSNVAISRAGGQLSGYSAMTVSAWIYVNQYTASYSGIVADLGGAWNERSFAITQEDVVGRIDFSFASGNNGQIVVVDNLPTQQWIHIACTFQANNLIIVYINGVLNQQASTTLGTLNTDTRNLYIGYYINKAFNGTIDEVRIYNRALTAEEILLLYASRGLV